MYGSVDCNETGRKQLYCYSEFRFSYNQTVIKTKQEPLLIYDLPVIGIQTFGSFRMVVNKKYLRKLLSLRNGEINS
ncbi:hypothetical protein BO224_09225 [Erysipelotrichaceae bacterium NYU-BL-E8]|uniref:Uncharacterized protein n=1 Tax=Ileibacterium valens TaxID=1862668 RepID=A0A1U7NFL2_9FIRM|nr:hypothetical protein BM735_12375 [Erysipelotrichaceae bacterium NYU-BL-F16]OLU38360.1 hypothetical protein BO224_09225 [Erysipelotrichaceae bacterium NYU-BL-E8]OLU39175.1 hypothetical protein BO222_07155 [Ileibacterium valens]